MIDISSSVFNLLHVFQKHHDYVRIPLMTKRQSKINTALKNDEYNSLFYADQ